MGDKNALPRVFREAFGFLEDVSSNDLPLALTYFEALLPRGYPFTPSCAYSNALVILRVDWHSDGRVSLTIANARASGTCQFSADDVISNILLMPEALSERLLKMHATNPRELADLLVGLSDAMRPKLEDLFAGTLDGRPLARHG